MNPPITLSSTYVHDSEKAYGRDGNDGWGAFEAAMGTLDGGFAVSYSSGLAAATSIADLVLLVAQLFYLKLPIMA